MDLDLSEQQKMLQSSARDFLATKYPMSIARKMLDEDIGCPPELWREIVRLGWLGLLFPKEYGGEGGNFMDLTVLCEELGRVCFLGPLFSTVFLGGVPILYGGNEKQKRELLPKICRGEIIATMALTECEISYTPTAIALEAIPGKDYYLLNGIKYFVLDANQADIIICIARTGKTEKQLTAFLVDGKGPGVEWSRLKTLSGSKQCKVSFKSVKVPKQNVLEEVDKCWPVIEKVLQLATIAKCAESVGSAQKVLDLTVEYAKTRRQFGQPIGTFEVIQHFCVDMLTDVETMRLAVHQAAWMLSEGIPCQKEVAMTKSWVGESFRHAALYGLKIHGGVGYMEEHDVSLYFRRAQEVFSFFGNSDFHREIVAQKIGI